MRINEIFKDFDDESNYYFIAKDIAEHIEISIDEIQSLNGYFDILETYVWFKGDNTVEISTSFRNLENDVIYSWDFTNRYGLYFTNSIPKVLFCWINIFQKRIDEINHSVNFNFGGI